MLYSLFKKIALRGYNLHHHSLRYSLETGPYQQGEIPLLSPLHGGTIISLTSVLPVVPSVLLLIVMLQRQYIFAAMTVGASVGFIASNGIAALVGMCFCNWTD